MCRALVWHTVTLADHVSLVAEPLFTLYRPDGDVYRVMFRVTRRVGESRLAPQMLGLCRACNGLLGPFEEDLVLGVHRPSCDCGSSEVAFWGPVWTGQLQSDDFLQQLERVAEGSYQPLHDLRREAFVVSTKPWTLRLAEVARRAQRPPVKMEKLLQVEVGSAGHFSVIFPFRVHPKGSLGCNSVALRRAYCDASAAGPCTLAVPQSW